MNWLGLLGTGLDLYGIHEQSEADQEQASHNRISMLKEAEYQEHRGEVDAARYMESVEKMVGKGDVAYAKGGVRLHSSSVMDVYEENMQEGLINAELIKREGYFQAQKSRTQAERFNIMMENAEAMEYAGYGDTLLTSMQPGGGLDFVGDMVNAGGDWLWDAGTNLVGDAWDAGTNWLGGFF